LASIQNRKILAAALLVLYTFIVTPVQFWHHHHIEKQTKQIADTKLPNLSKNAGFASEENCPICNHTYSVYSDDAFVTIIPFVRELSSENGYYKIVFFSSVPSLLSNKGPPSLS